MPGYDKIRTAIYHWSDDCQVYWNSDLPILVPGALNRILGSCLCDPYISEDSHILSISAVIDNLDWDERRWTGTTIQLEGTFDHHLRLARRRDNMTGGDEGEVPHDHIRKKVTSLQQKLDGNLREELKGKVRIMYGRDSKPCEACGQTLQ